MGVRAIPTKAVAASKKNCSLPDACGAAVLGRAWNSPQNKSAPGVLPSFLEVPSEVPGEEVLVQTKVTQIAPAAQNVVGDLQEAGRSGTSRSCKSPLPGAGEEKARPADTKSISLACSGVSALGGWVWGGKEIVVKHQE